MILGHAAYASLAEVRIALLYALEAAEPLKPRFLPLRDQGRIRPLLLQAVFVELSRDLSLFVEELEDVPRHLVVQLVDGPDCLYFTLAFCGLILYISQFLL